MKWSFYESAIVLVATLVVLKFAVAQLPEGSHHGSRKLSCTANLKQLDLAKNQWAIDHHAKAGTVVAFTDLVGPALYMKSGPTCACGGIYTLNPVGTPAGCSIQKHVLP